MPQPTIDTALWQSWFDAAGSPPVSRALLDVYSALNDEITALKPTCWLSGKCCKFDTYGHKLYVTGLEIAYAVMNISGKRGATGWMSFPTRAIADEADARVEKSTARLSSPKSQPVAPELPSSHSKNVELHERLQQADLPTMDGCPFQINGLCGIHALRPLGCRVYFCDATAQHWQNDIYEKFLSRLRTLHDVHALDYRYMEWRAGLAEARQFRVQPRSHEGHKSHLKSEI